jgi:hypothetical protein
VIALAPGRRAAWRRQTGSPLWPGRIPAGPGSHSPHLRMAAPGKAPGHLRFPQRDADRRSSPIAISFGESRRAGCARSRTPRRPGPARAPGRPRSTADFGFHWETSWTLNTREVGRGRDSSSADARQGPPDMVRTPPAAAVCSLPRIRRQAPGRGLAPDGRRRARRGRVSTRGRLASDHRPWRAAVAAPSPRGLGRS